MIGHTIIVSVFFLFLSCSTKSTLRVDTLSKIAKKDNYQHIINTIQKDKKRLYGTHSQLLYLMDVGLLFHYAQIYDSSNLYLEKAVAEYDRLFARSVTNEAAAILTNDNIRPYRSKPYELLLVHQTMMLNYLATKRVDEALVETRRAQLLSNEWERKDRMGTKYTADGLFHYLSALTYHQVDEIDNSAISLYKSIQAYRDGGGTAPSHVELVAYNTFTKTDRIDDIKTLQLDPGKDPAMIGENKRGQSEIVLIGYAGRGPVLEEEAWWGTWVKDGTMILHHKNVHGERETMTMPAPAIAEEESDDGEKTESGMTLHIKFALPKMRVSSSRVSSFNIKHQGSGQEVTTIQMNDMDALCAQALEDSKAKTMMRTATRVVIRTLAAQKAKKEMQTENGLVNLLLNVGTDIMASQLEKADTRAIFLIPQSIHLARIPIKPGSHTVLVNALDRGGNIVETKEFYVENVSTGEKRFLFYPALY